MELKNKTYGIVGLGIMGGSFAKSIRENILSQNGSTGKILVCNRSTACLSMATSEGVADEAFPAVRDGEGAFAAQQGVRGLPYECPFPDKGGGHLWPAGCLCGSRTRSQDV